MDVGVGVGVVADDDADVVDGSGVYVGGGDGSGVYVDAAVDVGDEVCIEIRDLGGVGCW